MNVLSLFDGMSCGRIALEIAGIRIDNYYSSEINKDAIAVSRDNYPYIRHIGNVEDISAYELPIIDLLIGGSPCQGFSFAGKGLNFDDPRSKLFFEFIRLLDEIRVNNPDVKFLLENVIMKTEHKNVITNYLGVEPISINSNMFSAQNRNRIYWTNIKVDEIIDKNILLSDIVEKNTVYPNLVPNNESCNYETCYVTPRGYNKGGLSKNNKSNCVTTSSWEHNIFLAKGNRYRSFSRNEVERLQTVPDEYTRAVSKNKAVKLLGNGWTVDVIAHIFKGLVNDY